MLAVAAPLGLAVALLARPSPPTMDDLPVTGTPTTYTETMGQPGSVQVDDATLAMTLLRSASAPARYAVRIAPVDGRGVSGPDVLVYWSASAASGRAGVPDGAFLLGTLAGGQRRTLALPGDAAPGRGQVSFYSLAHERAFKSAWPLPAAD